MAYLLLWAPVSGDRKGWLTGYPNVEAKRKGIDMLKSSEMLKAAFERKGIDWSTKYSGALAMLLDVFDTEIADAMVQRAVERVDSLTDKANQIENDLNTMRRAFQQNKRAAEETAEKAEKAVEAMKAMKEGVLTNPRDAESLSLYKQLLKAGVDVFGQERMSDSAIASICESASYIVYRTVMGPKHDENDTRPVTRRY